MLLLHHSVTKYGRDWGKVAEGEAWSEAFSRNTLLSIRQKAAKRNKNKQTRATTNKQNQERSERHALPTNDFVLEELTFSTRVLPKEVDLFPQQIVDININT